MFEGFPAPKERKESNLGLVTEDTLRKSFERRYVVGDVVRGERRKVKNKEFSE